jgi:hypothetical protein
VKEAKFEWQNVKNVVKKLFFRLLAIIAEEASVMSIGFQKVTSAISYQKTLSFGIDIRNL